MGDRTAPAGVLHGPKRPASGRLCHGGGGPPAWVDAGGSGALSLRETQSALAQEDIRDGWWKGERSLLPRQRLT